MKHITITTSRHITADSHPHLFRVMRERGWTGRVWTAHGPRGAAYEVNERQDGSLVILNSRLGVVRDVEITNREEIA